MGFGGRRREMIWVAGVGGGRVGYKGWLVSFVCGFLFLKIIVIFDGKCKIVLII